MCPGRVPQESVQPAAKPTAPAMRCWSSRLSLVQAHPEPLIESAPDSTCVSQRGHSESRQQPCRSIRQLISSPCRTTSVPGPYHGREQFAPGPLPTPISSGSSQLTRSARNRGSRQSRMTWKVSPSFSWEVTTPRASSRPQRNGKTLCNTSWSLAVISLTVCCSGWCSDAEGATKGLQIFLHLSRLSFNTPAHTSRSFLFSLSLRTPKTPFRS